MSDQWSHQKFENNLIIISSRMLRVELVSCHKSSPAMGFFYEFYYFIETTLNRSVCVSASHYSNKNFICFNRHGNIYWEKIAIDGSSAIYDTLSTSTIADDSCKSVKSIARDSHLHSPDSIRNHKLKFRKEKRIAADVMVCATTYASWWEMS